MSLKKHNNSIHTSQELKIGRNLQNILPWSTMYILISCAISSAAIVSSPLPQTWTGICTSQTDLNILKDYVDNFITETLLFQIQCHVTEEAGDTWRFKTLQDHLKEIHDLSVFLHVKCSNGGKISLPWPMKANAVVGLVVTDCILTDKYADFQSPDISEIPDQLRVLEIRNSIWVSDGSGFDKITSPEGLASLTSDYDCGQDSTIEYLVTSNVSDAFIPPAGDSTPPRSEKKIVDGTDIHVRKLLSIGNQQIPTVSSEVISVDQNNLAEHKDIATTENLDHSTNSDLFSNLTFPTNDTKTAQNDFMTLLENLQSLNLKCHFEKLKLIDESYPQFLPIKHFSLMVQDASYPELKVMNYSMSGIRQLPQELQDFRTYFPKLEYIDLSRNYLTEVHLEQPPIDREGVYLTLNVRSNLITDISLQNVVSWSKITDVVVDIRDNPIHCGCQIEQLLHEIQSGAFFVGNLQKYSYIQELECASPSQFKGQRLSDVRFVCTAGNQYSVSTSLDQAPSSSKATRITLYSILAASLVILPILVYVVARKVRCRNEMFEKKAIDNSSKGTPRTDAELGFPDMKKIKS